MNSMHKEIVISRLTAWLVALLAVWLTACSDEEKHEVVLPPGTPVTAHFCLSAANSGITTRADEVEENMKSWVVIITNQSNGNGTVENVFTKDNVGNLTEDVVANFTTQVTTGTKRIYSFANITPAQLETALELTKGDISSQTLVGKPLTDEAVKAATFAPQGNNWTATKDAEGKYVGGIPMSNWQEIEIKSDNKSYTLYVCRMIAKVEFKLENKTGQNITVKNVTISDITSNESPVMLMPKTSVTAERDIKQSVNLPMASDSASVSVETTEVKALKEDGTDAITLLADDTTSVTVYVNESQVQSDYGLFRLTLTIDRGTGEEEELRYALLSDESSNWTWIARNDHRIIPITIDDYKLDLVPVDFPPIGVYPASVKEDEEGSFTCTFYAGGNFHLAPVVTRYSTGESLPYGWGGNEVSLAAYMFNAWDGVGADAQVTGAAEGEIHIGENLKAGAMVYGTSTVYYLNYADLTGCEKMIIEGTPGVQLRVLMNRLVNEGQVADGNLTEVNVTIDADGKAEVSFSGMEFVHLNAIKTNWGSPAGTITKISLVKPYSWNITSFTTPETTPAGDSNNTTAIYATPLSWNGKDLVLTGEFNNGVTGEAYHELKVTVNKGNGVTQTLLGRIWVKLAGGSN